MTQETDRAGGSGYNDTYFSLWSSSLKTCTVSVLLEQARNRESQLNVIE